MTRNDEELKRMFEATRSVDQRLQPAFGELVNKVAVPRVEHAQAVMPRSAPMAVAITAAAVVAAVLLCSASRFGWKDVATVASSHDDLQKLNQVCDSLLVAIIEPDVGMKWTTETDSLLPQQAVNFQIE
jgi:hypothetical protein